MIKYVIIGVVALGLVAVILWNFWHNIVKKNKSFSARIAELRPWEWLDDTAEKIKLIDSSRKKLWVAAAVVTIVIIAVVIAFFFVSKDIFSKSHEHSYQDCIIKAPTCYADGTKLWKCRYCEEQYEDTMASVDHRYVETNHHDATCTLEGIVEYTCEMCADVKMAAIPLKNHQYTEYVEQKPSCTAEGLLAKQCENCDHTVQETIPVNDEHHFELESYIPAGFWKSGYNRYSCRECGWNEVSPQVKSWNAYVSAAIVVFLVSVLILFANQFESASSFVALATAVLSISFMVFHWGWIIPPQIDGMPHTVPIVQKMLIHPVDHELLEKERVESSYSQSGKVVYYCETCDKEYTESLTLKQIDLSKTPQYEKPEITEKEEKEKNNSLDRANLISVNTKMTGFLSDSKDVDYYKVELTVAGSIKFVFTHESSAYAYPWAATIYDRDKSTVLADGYINQSEFGCTNLEPGTYYLKISANIGGNPLLNGHSDAKYHIMFDPSCSEHVETTQYFLETPGCSKSVDIIAVCDLCDNVIAVEHVENMEHRWDEWELKNTGTAISMEKRERTCVLCGETETLRRAVYWWVIPLLVLEALSLVFCAVLVFNESERCVIPILMHLLMGTVVAATLRQIPFFDGGKVDAIILGVLLSIHLLLMSESVYVLAQDWRRSCYRYSTLPTVFFVIGLLLMFLVGPLLDAITCVILALVMGVYAGGLAFVALFDFEKGHASWDIIVAIGNLAVAVIYMFRI